MDRTENSRDAVQPGPGLECKHPDNPPENRFCGRCGAPLVRAPARSGELVPRAKEDNLTLRKRLLPQVLGPVGKTVVVSLTAVGLAWLRYRLEKTDRSVLPHHVWREEEPKGGPEYLHGYFLREAALLLREGQETRGWFYSELTVRSNHPENKLSR